MYVIGRWRFIKTYHFCVFFKFSPSRGLPPLGTMLDSLTVIFLQCSWPSNENRFWDKAVLFTPQLNFLCRNVQFHYLCVEKLKCQLYKCGMLCGSLGAYWSKVKQHCKHTVVFLAIAMIIVDLWQIKGCTTKQSYTQPHDMAQEELVHLRIIQCSSLHLTCWW